MNVFDRLRALLGIGDRRIRSKLGLAADRRQGERRRAERAEFLKLANEAERAGDHALAGLYRVEAENDRRDHKTAHKPRLGGGGCADDCKAEAPHA